MSKQEIVKTRNAPISFSPETLIAQAIDKGVPVETMEKLLAMRRELKAEWAKEEFDKAMSNFQAECPIIEKKKEAKDNSGKVLYKYAPLDSIVEQTKDAIGRNGLSYTNKTEITETRVKVFCTIKHISGHSETTDVDMPLGARTAIMSAPQQVAATLTFAKRYAFCNALGIQSGDEDTDAATAQPQNQFKAPTQFATTPKPQTPVSSSKPSPSPVQPPVDTSKPTAEGEKKTTITRLCKRLDPNVKTKEDFEALVKSKTGFKLEAQWYDQIIKSLERKVEAESDEAVDEVVRIMDGEIVEENELDKALADDKPLPKDVH